MLKHQIKYKLNEIDVENRSRFLSTLTWSTHVSVVDLIQFGPESARK